MTMNEIGGIVGIVTGVIALVDRAYAKIKGQAASPLKFQAVSAIAYASQEQIVTLSKTLTNLESRQLLTEKMAITLSEREDERHETTSKRIELLQGQLDKVRDREADRQGR